MSVFDKMRAAYPDEEIVLVSHEAGKWECWWVNDINSAVALSELMRGKYEGVGSTPKAAAKACYAQYEKDKS